MSNPISRWLYALAIIIIIVCGIIIIIIHGPIPNPPDGGGCTRCNIIDLAAGINVLAGIGIILTARKINQQQRD